MYNVGQQQQERLAMFNKLLVATIVLAASNQVMADHPASMNLSGTATVTASPDIAYISAAVVSKDDDAQTALEENSILMTAIYKTLDEVGITLKEIKTSNFSFNRTYRRVKTGDNYKNVFDGYQVSNNIRIEVCDLSILGKVMTAMVGAGVTDMGQVSFGSTEATAKLDEARKLAMQDALKKAKIYAENGDFKLVRITNLSEQQSRGREIYARAALASADSMAVPVSGGALSFSMTIQVSWEIEPVWSINRADRVRNTTESLPN